MQDSEIIELYLARSEEAVSETGSKYGVYCTSIAYSILNDRSDSEEVVNDAYLRVWNTIPPKRPQSLKAYLGRIVRNLSLNVYEKYSAQKRGKGNVRLVLEELAEVIASDEGVEKHMREKELAEIFDRFLSGLDESERIMFVRRYWYMSSIKDIARDYHISEGAAKMRLKRTRDKLKEFLRKEGWDNE